jgi:hypothetical protein
MKLFASATWTSGENGLRELRNNYQDLFRSTSDRQIFINKMDWKFKNNRAMGTGDIVINLLSTPDSAEALVKKQGKVRMIVEKTDEKVRISHLFNIVN